MDFEPYFKVHNLASVRPKSIILGQITNLNIVIKHLKSDSLCQMFLLTLGKSSIFILCVRGRTYVDHEHIEGSFFSPGIACP